MFRHIEMDYPAAAVLDEEETRQDSEGEGRHGEEVRGHDRIAVIAKDTVLRFSLPQEMLPASSGRQGRADLVRHRRAPRMASGGPGLASQGAAEKRSDEVLSNDTAFLQVSDANSMGTKFRKRRGAALYQPSAFSTPLQNKQTSDFHFVVNGNFFAKRREVTDNESIIPSFESGG